MRGKRELRRKKNPLVIAAVSGAVMVLLAAGLFFLRPSGPGQKIPAGSETLAASSGQSEVPGGSQQPVPKEENRSASAKPEGEPPDQSRFVLSFLGDCTLTSSHYTGHFESVVGDDLEYPFSNVAEILAADDLTLANLECSFSDRRLESESEYAFCGQPKHARCLALGGVDRVSMANNHTGDFGPDGVADTAAALEAAGVTGIREDQGVCFNLRHEDGTTLRVGIYVLKFNGSTEQVKAGAARLREDGADVVIACMHAGAEKIYVPTKRQTYLAHAAINGGADVVVGTHPHVLQPVEEYQGGVILYSLGNFCFGGNRNPGDKDTVIARLVVRKEESGISREMVYIPCSVSSVTDKNDYCPTPYEEGTESYQRCLHKLEAPWDPTTAEEAAAARAAAEGPEFSVPGTAGDAGAGTP